MCLISLCFLDGNRWKFDGVMVRNCFGLVERNGVAFLTRFWRGGCGMCSSVRPVKSLFLLEIFGRKSSQDSASL